MKTAEQVILNLQAHDIQLWVEEGKLRYRAPKDALTDPLRAEIAQYRTEILALLTQSAAQAQPRQAIQPAPRPERLPLSFAQQRLWFLNEFGSGAAYNMPMALAMTGKLNVAALQQTLHEVVRRHESLRTTFAIVEGTPYQVIQPARPFALPLVDLRALAADAQRVEVQRLCEREAEQPFDLSQDCMLRGQVLQLAEEHFVLVLTMHHIAADGWSMGVLVREWNALYTAFSQGQPSPLPELALQYVDFALWQRSYLQGDVLAQQTAYWKRQLTGAPELLQLPTDRPRTAQQSFRGATVTVAINPALTQQLRHLSQAHGATLYMTLLAAFQLLLARISGQQEIVVASPIANRHRQELEPLIGFFVNTLALRGDLRANPSFLTLLDQVKATTQAAYDHQDLPFERLVEELNLQRNLNHNPLVQVMFALQNTTMGQWELPGLQVKLVDVETQTTRFDLEVHCWEQEDALHLYAVYNVALFDQATIQRLMRHFQTLLAAIVAQPQSSISELPLLTPAERHQLLVEWNNTATAYAKEKTIQQLFEEQAARTPAAIAVVMAEEQGTENRDESIAGRRALTYQELNERANQLAHHLQKAGVGANQLVGLCLERSPEMIVALLAILKAGAGYVPFDPTYPTERLAYMVENAKIQLLVTSDGLRPQLAWAERTPCFTDWAQLAEQSKHNPAPCATPETVVYCLYTSGSTGTPKGVVMPHRAISNLIQWQLNYTTVAPQARTLQYTPLNFDVSCQEIFATLCAGGTLVLVDSERRRDPYALLAYLEQQAIERLYLPFVALQQLAEAANGQMPSHLREVNTAGEQLQITPAIAQWFRQTNCRLQNHYGPTETHAVTALPLPPCVDEWPPLPTIGRPIANTQIYILDRALQPTPIGVAGELYIGGIALADGYSQRPDLTVERFVRNPFADGRLYKTGDLARWLPDGNLEYLGRIDQQVKIRGFRIEVGEIEAVLNQHPTVQEAVVIAHNLRTAGEASRGRSEKRLVAYVVKSQKSASNEPAAGNESQRADNDAGAVTAVLRSYLQSKLPEYMIPSFFVIMEALPLTPSGKVDRKALPEPAGTGGWLAATYVAPSAPIEVQLATIWQTVLGLEQVGIHANFFDVGGHSLLVIKMHQLIQSTLGRTLPVADLFRYPTIHQLGQHLAATEPARPDVLTTAQTRAEQQRNALQQRRQRYQRS